MSENFLIYVSNVFEDYTEHLRNVQSISYVVIMPRWIVLILSPELCAQVLGNLRQYDKAIQELHFAMSSCAAGSDLSLAIQEIDRIESLLQGQDLSVSNDYYDPSLRSVSPSL